MRHAPPAGANDSARARWEAEVLAPALKAQPERADLQSIGDGLPIERVYVPADVHESDAQAIGDPGGFPYTRGVHASGYRGKRWTMRQFAGYGTPEETNRRYKTLLAEGGTGLSVAFDLPTLMGRDPDDPLAAGEVGRCGVSVATVADMEALFDGISLADVSTSMTINGPAPMLFAMYLVVAERRGVSWATLRGTLQNDILKEFVAQKEYLYPPRPSMRLATDVMLFASRHVPKWNSVSVSGYHIREAGSTAVQELAFTIADGLAYVDAAVRAGASVDDVAPRLSFFFNAHSNFFEEVAKFRAARRLWAEELRARFHPSTLRACQLRFHAQTSGATLTAQQPYNNVVRTAIQAMAAVLGGANSLHTNALDEAVALPTTEAATLALRTQQVLAHETGVADVVDPLGGSWFIERLTSEMVDEARAILRRIDAAGGMVAAVERGVPQGEIADAAYRTQRAIEDGRRTVVGVNAYRDRTDLPIPVLEIDEAGARIQCERVQNVRARRDARAVTRAIEALAQAASGTGDTMAAVLEAARASATLGEMCGALRNVWGDYVETPSV